MVGVVVFLAVFSIVVFFAPEMGGYFLEYNNFIPADPLKTPPHIAPVWYFTPYYAMLRAVPAFLGTQFWGVLVMGAAVLIFFLLPWLDRSPVKSIRYKGPVLQDALALFVLSFLMLGWLGTQPTDFLGKLGGTDAAVILARLFTLAVLRVLPAHALVQPHRPHQARARARDRVGGRRTRPRPSTMKKILFVLLALPLAAHAAGEAPEARPRAHRPARCRLHPARCAGIRQLLPELPQRRSTCATTACWTLGLTEQQIRDNLMFATARWATP